MKIYIHQALLPGYCILYRIGSLFSITSISNIMRGDRCYYRMVFIILYLLLDEWIVLCARVLFEMEQTPRSERERRQMESHARKHVEKKEQSKQDKGRNNQFH